MSLIGGTPSGKWVVVQTSHKARWLVAYTARLLYGIAYCYEPVWQAREKKMTMEKEEK